MFNECDEFYDYDIPEENAIIDDLKKLLRNQVSEEIKSKIENLEKENKSLTQENYNLKKKVANVDKLEDELRVKISNAKRDFYYEKIKNILNFIPNIKDLFIISYELEKMPKCNCCDESRKITFTDTLGRKYQAICKCYGDIRKYYYTQDKKLIKINKSNEKLFLVIDTPRSDYYNSERYINIYEDKENIIEKFDENNPPDNYNRVFFTDENEAKKYVDWLNKKEEEKEKK